MHCHKFRFLASAAVSISSASRWAIKNSVMAASVGGLLAKPNIEGAFKITDGSISNVDLVQAMRTPGSVGGLSKFGELSGKVSGGGGAVKFESLKLTGGVLLANGNVTASTGSGSVSGIVNAELRSNVMQDKAVFSVTGTVARPALKRGG